ncbi:ferredoxin--NADP reductase [Nocardia callitridis]|uniref:Ferredoxin--NADP reductase n=1 Tax=Nocardia callitridis TaxID=648753 RepID=A0ABP9KPS3_9NOCA
MTSEQASGATESAGREAIGAVDVTDGFVPVPIRTVTRETVDAVSLTLDLASVAEGFDYRAGQFITVSVPIGAQWYRRCYSMSSAPSVDKGLRITVKRSIGGPVSNWINDNARAGDVLNVRAPEGRFVLDPLSDAPLVALAGGSGITPILSLIRTALHTTDRRLKLLYANRDRDSIIFRDELDDLAELFGDRLEVGHHLDVDSGLLTRDQIVSVLDGCAGADFYICGPRKFMDVAEEAVIDADPRSVHLERFETAEIPPPEEVSSVATPTTEEVTIRLGRQKVTVAYRRGSTLLQTARSAGLRAPSSCETGSCGTCMARLRIGSARMVNNDVLDDDEVAEGWVLTCQSLPTSPTVHVSYE